MATSRLMKHNISDTRREQLLAVISKAMIEWNFDARRFYSDCMEKFELEFDKLTSSGHEARFIGADALGIWIVINVLERSPQSKEDFDLIRGIGSIMVHTFFDYWEE